MVVRFVLTGSREIAAGNELLYFYFFRASGPERAPPDGRRERARESPSEHSETHPCTFKYASRISLPVANQTLSRFFMYSTAF